MSSGKQRFARRVSVWVIAVFVTAAAANAFAGSDLSVNDRIRFIDRAGSPGGEFGIAKTNGTTQVGSELFVTFCVQATEYIDFNVAGFFVKSITDHTVAGNKPLTPGAAFLYTQFRNGTLPTYDGSGGKANELQQAIWAFQTESGGDANTNFYKYALAQVTAGTQTVPSGYGTDGNSWVGMGIGNVRIANLTWATTRGGFLQGANAQDQLVLVPTPTASVASSGLLAMLACGAVIRRRALNASSIDQ